MTELPASIEAALLDAGFSGTEVVVIKKLLQEDALTLRELAAKTGKSTGVLDQAVKKLVKKGILSKEQINESPKYILKSLDVVLKWMEDDTKMKQEMMIRRQQNFETFVKTLVAAQNSGRRPEMEYFEGKEGVKKAYMQILNRGNDIAMYGPTLYLAEDDPLRDFKVQWFRERQHRGIFARVITDDTPLGRRFRSRDPYEYRKTILVDPDTYPLQFERMIVGDTIACFQPEQDRAVFVRYPEYAEAERVFFERLWNKKIQRETEANAARNEAGAQKQPLDVITIPMKTKTLSSLREFFLSKKSVAALVLCTILAAAGTYGYYEYNLKLSIKRVQDRVRAIAATGALQFDSADLDELRTPEDITKPQYAKVVSLLNLIREENEGVAYAYILRPADPEKETSYIVADADSLDPNVKRDINLDGKIDEGDQATLPGYISNDAGSIPPIYEGYKKPTAFEPYYDKQWGTVISGLAPIKDRNGKVVAGFEVDVFLDQVMEITGSSFTPSLVFIGLLFVFIVIRLAAFNRSLFKEICELIKIRKVMIIVSTAALVSILITFGLYEYTQHLTLNRMKDKVAAIASTAITQFDFKEIEALQIKDDWKKPEWEKIVRQLQKIRAENTDVFYAYIFRKSKTDPTKMEFVSDADSLNPYANTDNDPTNDVDMNHDGKIDGSPTGGDYQAWPGQPYLVAPPEGFDAYNGPTTTHQFYEDQWGKYISGYAPIRDASGAVVGILAIDMSGSSQHSLTNEVFAPLTIFIICFVLFILIQLSRSYSSFFI